MAVDTRTIGQLPERTLLLSTDLFEIQGDDGLSYSATTQDVGNFIGAITVIPLSNVSIDVSKDWAGEQIKNVGDPTAAQDVVTRAYGDANYLGVGITSINADTTAAQIIAGTTNHITVNTVTGTTTLDIGTDVVTLVDAQILTNKSMDADNNTFTNFALDAEVTGAINDLSDVDTTGFGLGSIIYKSAGDWVILAAGTNGQILTLAAGIPSWAAAPITGITALNLDTATAQTLTGGDGIDIVDSSPDHSFAVDSTVLRTTGAQTILGVKIFNDTTLLLRNVANTFNASFVNTNTVDRIYTLQDSSDVLVGRDTTDILTNKTLTTPTIGSFTNAVHNHEDAAGGGQLTAIDALDATGPTDSTTFLRGDNTWSVPVNTQGYDTIEDEGVLVTQRTTVNFIGPGVTAVDNAGQNRTDVTIATVAGSFGGLTDVDTTGEATGDIIFKSAGDWIVLPIGSEGQHLHVLSGLPAWTDLTEALDDLTDVTITAPTVDDLLVSDVEGAWVNRQGVFPGITGVGILTQNLVTGNNDVIVGSGTIEFSTTTQNITPSGVDLVFNIASGLFTFAVSASSVFSITATKVDLMNNELDNVGIMNLNATGQLFLDGGGDTSLQEQGADDVILNVGSVQGFEWQEIGTEVNSIVGKLSALALTATDGFLHISSTPGTPTGVPTAYAGKAPIVFDSTNNLMYAYNSGWNVISGVKITTASGTHVQATNTNEQQVLEILSNVNNVEVSMDFTELLQDTVVNVYEKMDAATYILISSATYSTVLVDSDFTGQAGVITLNGKGQDQRITLTSAVAEAAARDVDFARVDVVRTE